jgi:uncharacterized membrane protein
MKAMAGIGGTLYFLMIIKEILQVLFYISIIIVLYKVLQVLNIYINKNS